MRGYSDKLALEELLRRLARHCDISSKRLAQIRSESKEQVVKRRVFSGQLCGVHCFEHSAQIGGGKRSRVLVRSRLHHKGLHVALRIGDHRERCSQSRGAEPEQAVRDTHQEVSYLPHLVEV